ncbi:MAG: RNA 3'-terminal phosphate cyclase [bacterium]
MIQIDGSFGEGGGQILRTALALSLVTQKPFIIKNIRAGRKKKGLLRQHLTAVDAAAEISRARVEGSTIASSQVFFAPRKVATGDFRFAVGTAGSTTLVLQTVLPALISADKPATLTLEGGTHNPFAPPFDFFQKSFLRVLNQMGAKVTADIDQYGFYPVGGGRIHVNIVPCQTLAKLALLDKGELLSRRAFAYCSKIPDRIGQEEMSAVVRKLGWNRTECQSSRVPSSGPGNIVLLELAYEHITEVFTGFGQKNIPKQKVVAEAIRELQEYLEARAPVGKYLADQLLLPMAMAGQGEFITMKPTLHAMTNMAVIRKFLDIRIDSEQIDALRWKIQIRSRNG